MSIKIDDEICTGCGSCVASCPFGGIEIVNDVTFSEEAFQKCIHVSRSMTNIELTNYQPYMDEYIAALFLPHTDRRLFPSVTNW